MIGIGLQSVFSIHKGRFDFKDSQLILKEGLLCLDIDEVEILKI